MKKFFSVALVAAAVATMMSCGNNPKPSLKTDVDTLSYAIQRALTLPILQSSCRV